MSKKIRRHPRRPSKAARQAALREFLGDTPDTTFDLPDDIGSEERLDHPVGTIKQMQLFPINLENQESQSWP